MNCSIDDRKKDISDIIPSADGCIYTNCYCEENVWKICERVQNDSTDNLSDCFVVFISNENKTIPLWRQKAAKDREEPVVWDYHVIFVLRRSRGSAFVYDLDSALPFPCEFQFYVKETFKQDEILLSQFYRMFRVVPSSIYLETFASDRSHMTTDDGKYTKPPPNYPCIRTTETSNNLADFINMDPDIGIGEIFNLEQFKNLFNIDSHLDTR